MKLMAPLGVTMMGVMVDEVLRGIDALAHACESVDARRIGVTGFSLGGNVAWFSAACSHKNSRPALHSAVVSDQCERRLKTGTQTGTLRGSSTAAACVCVCVFGHAASSQLL
eukprot:SAG11_NODE_3562_length_2370_cov_4.250550_1_plen_112_part_00